MIVALPVMENGEVGGGWGRAQNVAVAAVGANAVERWEEFRVGWDELHDTGGEGQHHARIARFLMDHNVERVVTGHMGPGMVHMLGKMNISVVQNAFGDAKEAARRYGREGGPA
jgi:predicted Fe-Mo cluster-binding NifX family protein